ncbi:MAG: hypothetical protein JXJ04_11495 [Spirochaetales bacterium]|nr:hypothetical protein [Spirochaetales bacterium]
MDVIAHLSSSQGLRDDIPNQKLAKELVVTKDSEAINVLVEHLSHEDKKIQSDCIKVLYEVGYLNPELIAHYFSEFLRLLKSRQNRLVWGGMIALSTIAELKAKEILTHVDEIYKAISAGSVITVDSGIKALALAAKADKTCKASIFPYLIHHLKTCRPKEIPMHGEFISEAVDASNKKEFIEVLEKRKDVLTPSQLKRVERILKNLGN